MAVLAECLCHRKQSVKNKLCPSCGEDLVKLKRSNKVKYWITYRLPDRQQRRECVGYSIEEARDADGKRRVQKREHRIFDILPQADMTFQEMADWYLNLESVKSLKYYQTLSLSLMKFNRIFGNRIVGSIETSELENYQAKRRNEGKAPSTIDQETGVAKAVINKAFKDNKVGGNVLKTFQNVKKLLKRNSNERKRTLTPMEFHELAKNIAPHLRPIVWTAYDTGMRKSEILGLTWERISLKDRIIKLRPKDTKDKEPREIPICNELFEILNRLPRGIQSDYPVFPYKGKAIGEDIRSGLTPACEKAGILYGRFKEDGFIFHDLRRTFVTDMRRAGAQESVIMEITGHARGEVFDRYNQVNVDDMRRAVERLVDYRRGQIANVDQTVDQSQFLR